MPKLSNARKAALLRAEKMNRINRLKRLGLYEPKKDPTTSEAQPSSSQQSASSTDFATSQVQPGVMYITLAPDNPIPDEIKIEVEELIDPLTGKVIQIKEEPVDNSECVTEMCVEIESAATESNGHNTLPTPTVDTKESSLILEEAKREEERKAELHKRTVKEFGEYVVALLLSVPPDVAERIQMKIVELMTKEIRQ